MPLPLTYPGVYIEEVPSGVRTITGVATSIGLFIGWAARGPIDEAVRIFSFADYERTYGGLDQRTLLGYAVQQFFDNGGSDAYVIRLVAADDDASSMRERSRQPSRSATSHSRPRRPANGRTSTRVRDHQRTDTGFTDRFKVEVVDAATQDGRRRGVREPVDRTDRRPLRPDAHQGSVSTTDHRDGRHRPIRRPASHHGLTCSRDGGDDGTVLDPNSTDDRPPGGVPHGGAGAVRQGRHRRPHRSVQPGVRARRVRSGRRSRSCRRVQGQARLPGRRLHGGRRRSAAPPRSWHVMNGGDPSYAGYYFPWVRRRRTPLQQGAIRGVSALRLRRRHLRAHRRGARRVEGAGGHRGRAHRRGRIQRADERCGER